MVFWTEFIPLIGAVWCDGWIWGNTDHGMPSMSTYLTHYRVGDIVDIKANASEQKGLVSHSFMVLPRNSADSVFFSPTNVSYLKPETATLSIS